MLIYLPASNRLITTQEGTGDNLLPEDEAEGCKDYWLSSLYEQDGEEIQVQDQAQILTTRLIGEMTLDEKIAIIKDYWEVHTEPHIILNHED